MTEMHRSWERIDARFWPLLKIKRWRRYFTIRFDRFTRLNPLHSSFLTDVFVRNASEKERTAIRWCSVQQVYCGDFLVSSVLFMTLPDDVSLVRIHLCTYCKGYGRKNEASGTCASARCIMRSDAFPSTFVSNKCEAVAFTFLLFFFPEREKRPWSPRYWKEIWASMLQKPRFVLDSIAMYRKRVVVYILAY